MGVRKINRGRRSLKITTVAAIAATAVLAGPATAGVFYWDANGSAAGTGGSGAWNGVTSNKIWRDGGVSGTLKEWSQGSDVVFGGNSGIVTFSTSGGSVIETNLLTFNTGGYAIIADGTNRTLKLKNTLAVNTADKATVVIGSATSGEQININLDGSTRTFNIAANDSIHFYNVISNGGISKTGAGTLILSGVNTYTGNTSVTAGVLAGNGTTNSTTTVSNGASIAPGVDGIGTLTFQRQLTFNSGSSLHFDLGTPANSDKITSTYNSTGNGLTFAGATTLNITPTTGFGSGVYTIFSLNDTVGNFGNLTVGSVAGTHNASFVLSQSSNEIVLTVTADNSKLNAGASAVDFGRVMQGAAAGQQVAISNTGSNSTTFDASLSGNARVALGSNAPVGSSLLGQSIGGSGSVDLNVGIDTSTTGSKAGVITVENNATSSADTVAGVGSSDAAKTIEVSGTVLQQREISSGSVSIGKVLVGHAIGGSATLSTDATAGNDDRNTRISVASTAGANGEGISVTGGAGSQFGGSGGVTTGSRSIGGSFVTSGVKSGSVELAVTSAEHVSVGDTSPYPNLSISYTADVYQPASLTVTGGSSLLIENADKSDGGQRAGARLTSLAFVSGNNVFSITGLTPGVAGVGTAIGQNGSAIGTIAFQSPNPLNGTYAAAYSLGFEHDDQSILGTAAGDLGTVTRTISLTASGYSGTQSVALQQGANLDGLSAQSDQARSTVATLLDGTLSANRTITTAWTAPAGGEQLLISDVLNLTGLAPAAGDELFVLQLTYDGSLVTNAAGRAAHGMLQLLWKSEGDWIHATEGNSSFSFLTTPHLRGYDANLGDFALGNWGIDIASNTVWAVVDHNSQFAVGMIPEPASLMLFITGGLLLTRRNRSV